MQPEAKMSSGQAAFDLKAAREAMTRATERPNVTTDIYHLAALTYLPAALDEIERQRHAIARLSEAKRERGKALVEERARRICHVSGDPVGHWTRYEKVVVDEAREQLRREGKL